MIQFSGVQLIRGGKILFDEVSFSVHSGQHVGLTGVNGSGKSSVFALIRGEIQCDRGEVSVPTSLRIAHMAQEVEALTRPAVEYVLDGDQALRSTEQAIQKAETTQDNHALAHLYDQLCIQDGYTARTRAEQLLAGLGFTQQQFEKPVKSFSGGWRMRLNLAQTLMMPSDLLLLDEPTNHLDLEAILWLESWLKQYKGTLIFISHDRIFLDRVADNILHTERKGITLYSGNYSAFERIRAAKLALQQATYEKQQKQKAHLQQFIDRFKAKATKARQAQSRIKMLEKMEEAAPAHIDSPFNFIFKSSEKISDPLLSVRKGVIGYQGKPWLNNIKISLHPDSRIGLLGANGAGKSTFIKALAGEHDFLSGQISQGEHLRIGYFAQHQLESLDPDASPCLHIQRISPETREQTIRDFLGGFAFHGDKALEAIKNFSGGEQARLALAIIAWKRPNLLLLDEPTNHLDLEMRYALTVALQSFTGAVVLISHDRSLMEAVADEFYLVHDHTLQPFSGDLAAYAKWLRDQSNAVAKKNSFSDKKAAPKSQHQPAKDGSKSKPSQKDQKQLEKLERMLTQKQQKLEEIHAQLTDTELYQVGNKEALDDLLKQQDSVKQEVEALEAQWLEMLEQME